MKRLVLFVAIIGWPLAAAAQVVPPTPPAPPAPAPAPVAAPAPPTPPSRAPRPVMAPVYVDDYAIREAVIAAREAQQIDVRAIQEEARAAQEAARVAQRAAADHMREAMVHAAPMEMFHVGDGRFAFQERPFAMSFGQDSDSNYSSGQSHLNQRQYDQAIMRFDRVIAQKTARADAAYYYKAFAQFRLGKTDEALTTIAALRKEYPQSRYLNDAKTLEADARRLKPQDIVDDDDIKLLAISAMQQAEAERAIPLLEEVLSKNNSLAIKKRAIYILALKGDQPRARQILMNYAKGGGNPDLQLEAIRYIAQNKDRQTQATVADLTAIYQTTPDIAVKMAIINAFRQSGNMPALVSIANAPNTPIAIRQSAISGISSIGSPQDLWALYQKEDNKELRLQMIGAFGSMQALDQLNQILKTEKDPEVRRRAVRSLGSLKTEQTGKMLVDMYGAETDVETRQAVISALGSQNNAEALVAIARKETNPQVKLSIVRRLTDMASRSKVAQDYLMELLRDK